MVSDCLADRGLKNGVWLRRLQLSLVVRRSLAEWGARSVAIGLRVTIGV